MESKELFAITNLSLFPTNEIPKKNCGFPFETIKTWECFDADTVIPDVSTWKTNHDAYKQAFDRPVRSLQPKSDSTATNA